MFQYTAVRILGSVTHGLFAAWAGLALYYTLPVGFWLRLVLAIGWVVAFVLARRRGLLLVRLSLAVAVLGFYLFTRHPNPNLNWAGYHSQVPIAEFDGDRAQVKNVRNFIWHSGSEYSIRFDDRTYDLNRIETMYYVVAPLKGLEAVAHVFVSFGFSDGQHLSISVEGRRQEGQQYRILPSLFRQYQLIYVVGDERDVVGLRGAIWKTPVRFYPARTSPERIRAIFVDMLKRADKLDKKPEYYHLLLNNCMNNITGHLRRLGGRPLPHDMALLLTGLSDRLAHRLGYIDTELPFEQAREVFRIDPWIQTQTLDSTFSGRLRDHLKKLRAITPETDRL